MSIDLRYDVILIEY